MRIFNAYLGSGCELHLTVRDHPLSFPDPFRMTVSPRWRVRLLSASSPLCCRLTIKTYCPVWPFSTAWEGIVSHWAQLEHHDDIDKLAGPKPLFPIGKSRLEADGPRILVDGVIHESKDSFLRTVIPGDKASHKVCPGPYIS